MFVENVRQQEADSSLGNVSGDLPVVCTWPNGLCSPVRV